MKLGKPDLVAKLLIGHSRHVLVFQFLLLLFALSFLITAITDPRISIEKPQTNTTQSNVIFLVDVSLSMLAEDVPPNRLEKAKYIISQTIAELTNAKVSIILFSGISYPLVPLTYDHSDVQNSLAAIQADILPVPGSSISEALKIATIMHNSNYANDNRFILISDGEDHTSDTETLLDSIANTGIRIYTIGIGTSLGSTIPLRRSSGKLVLKTDASGLPVKTHLKADVLKMIAERTGAEYITVHTTKGAVEFIRKAVVQNSTQEAYITAYYHRPLFQWLIGATLLLLLTEFFISKP
ncbi:Ca-activated chloride channel family protein [Pontibacter aydingkolensis]|uniref:VWA domain-containing protein n=1 Tax=Pontibacter aydingkolensis TaxID=1911536 RepID=A0ABS7CSS6_9BACT|nr:VWA domain-containing protein [Pontibacter aydingkolensis]MBW7466843.1 VWA domain-containing protein [Pontibacter aydingkolensis]